MAKKLRLRPASRALINRLFRDLFNAGKGLVTLAVALGAVAVIATQGATRPSSTWLEVVAVVLLTGTVFVAAGWLGDRVTARERVDGPHWETLRDTAVSLRGNVILRTHDSVVEGTMV